MKLENLCLVTAKIVAEVGAFIRDEFNGFDKSKIEHKGFNDLVSYVDKEAEEALVEELEMLFPEAGFITEEATKTEEKEYNWVIDPLDGTTNFVHGLPICAVSVALMKGEEVVIGVVYEIMQDRTFYAWKGGGAFIDDKDLRVSPTRMLSNSLVATGFPYYDFDDMEAYVSILKQMMKKSHGVRRLGSAAMDLCYVALGTFEAFYEYNLHAWDVAAGALIVQEAGGKVTDFKGKGDFVFGREIVASNTNVHAEVLDVIKKEWEKRPVRS